VHERHEYITAGHPKQEKQHQNDNDAKDIVHSVITFLCFLNSHIKKTFPHQQHRLVVQPNPVPRPMQILHETTKPPPSQTQTQIRIQGNSHSLGVEQSNDHAKESTRIRAQGDHQEAEISVP